MRHPIETGHALWVQHRGFAWLPKRTIDGWRWLTHYWLVVKLWGWGFSDEYVFGSEQRADEFFDEMWET